MINCEYCEKQFKENMSGFTEKTFHELIEHKDKPRTCMDCKRIMYFGELVCDYCGGTLYDIP